MAEYLRPTFGPFQIVIAGRSDQNVQSLFDHLDLDHDKKLSKAESKRPIRRFESSTRMMTS